MKKYLKSALAIAAALLIVAGTVLHQPAKHYTQKFHPVTPQQLAEHRVIFVGEGLCTATAVGPHALLTATHCDEDDKVKKIKLDLAVQEFNILAKTTDGRDHVIYIIDGPAFKNFILLQPGEHTARPAEHVHIYGGGGGAYPLPYKEGIQTHAVQDTSEVDHAEGLNFYTIPAIPGDSGSAIFGSDGRIIAVTTYKVEVPVDDNWDTEDDNDVLHLDAGFDVNFTAAQLASVAQGKGDTSLISPLHLVKQHVDFDLF
jgi:hypothetical protein